MKFDLWKKYFSASPFIRELKDETPNERSQIFPISFVQKEAYNSPFTGGTVASGDDPRDVLSLPRTEYPPPL